MFDKFISKILIKLLEHDSKVKESLISFIKSDEAKVNINEIAVQTSKEIVKIELQSAIVNLENDITSAFDSKLNDVVTTCTPEVTQNDLDVLQEQNDSLVDIIQNTIANNVAQCKKLINIANKTEKLEQQIQLLSKVNTDSTTSIIKSEFNENIKKTRADVATLIKTTRQDVTDLEIRLEAFIDTVSEKLAELKK